MRSTPFAIAVLGLVGCSKAERYDGPMPIAFGDCASATSAWVSGPRPLPFTVDEADAARLAELAPIAPPPTTAPPPVAAQPAPPAPVAAAGTDDPALSRQQAIQAARQAGILGATALQRGAFDSLAGGGSSDTNIYGGLLGNEAGEMTGGFGYGRSGFGPGGTGTGWGTIGRGSMHGRMASVPTLSIGQPDAQGALDKAVIRRYIRRNLQKIQYCYEKELLAKPSIAGTITTQFVIGPDGSVQSVTAKGMDPVVASCVAGVIKDIAFPKPKDHAVVAVNYPFTFRQGDGGPGLGSGGTAIAAAPPPPPPPPAPAPRVAPARDLFHIGPARDPEGYRTGVRNPLRNHSDALAECFRKQPKHAGVMVLELAYDATGAVSTAVAHGVDDDSTRSCILDLAKQVTGGSGKTERCSVAFGQLAVADLPGFEISKDAIAFGGKPVAPSDVYTAIDTRVRAAIANGAPVVALHGPLAVRAEPTAPMKLVNPVLDGVPAADDDLVLATHRPEGWALVVPMALPVVPVPIGTGARWGQVKGRIPRSTGALDDERVTLSILVTSKQIWVGLSRVNEFQEVPAGPAQLDRLLANLKEHKTSAFFADRTDIEIGGEDDVAYDEIVKIIEIADRVGFLTWAVATPANLTARPSL